MTGVRSPLLVGLALVALLFSTTSRAEEPNAEAPSKAEFVAKFTYCKTCHGLAGQGYRAVYPMPRLAGQQPDYFQNQLQAFIKRWRTSPVMFNVAHVLKPGMVTALAEGFKDLNPKPLGGEPKELIGAGKKIYEAGVVEASIPACASCHGSDAKGAGGIPRLAGQLFDYTTKKLTNWSNERGQDPAKSDGSQVMEPISHGLTAQQVLAVAAYLGSLE